MNENVQKNKEWLLNSRVEYMIKTINILTCNKSKSECFYEFDNELIRNFIKMDKTSNRPNKNKANKLDQNLNSYYLDFNFEQLLKSDSTGKWWLIGSSYATNAIDSTPLIQKENIKHDSKLIEQAKKHHMNSQLKINIFCTLMTSTNINDAFVKLIKLNLSGKETADIAYVIIYCCLQVLLFYILTCLGK